MGDSAVHGMVYGALYQLLFVKGLGAHAKREFPRMTGKELLGYGAVGAIGGGLGALVADSVWPDSALFFHLAVAVGVLAYDHFLLL